jgi:hypothetical protein
MDIDANDLLSTNTFIKNPDLTTNIPPDANEQFKRYYEKEMEARMNKKISKVASLDLDETTDVFNLLNTNGTNQANPTLKGARKLTEVKTFVSIDSRDRQKLIYPKPNHFKIFLGKTFYNVRTIRLASIEFPNTNAVINSNNNVISWRNLEDMESDFTVTATLAANNSTEAGTIGYPIYTNTLRVGSYIASTLQGEITSKLNKIPRQGGTSSLVSHLAGGNYHYFVINLDITTDIVSFTSLTLTPLQNNPFATTIGSDLIIVTTPAQTSNTSANYFTGYDQIYFVGSKTTAGIETGYLTGFQNITIISPTSISFSVNVKASSTVQGGGNVVQAGLAAPFQLLWGESSSSVAQNLGFPLENSSQLMYTNISNIQNIFQMVIVTAEPHGLSRSYDFISHVISVGNVVSRIFNQSYSFLITDIPTTTTIVVLVDSASVANSLLNNYNYVRFGTKDPIQTTNYYNFTQAFLVEFYTEHGYTLSDIYTSTVTLMNTYDVNAASDVSYDGTYTILEVPSPTQLILPGTLIKLNTHESLDKYPNGLYGNIPTLKPLTTHIMTILQLTPFTSTTTLVVCASDHNLQVGDRITINNVSSVPLFISDYEIISVVNLTSFIINFSLTSAEISTTSYVGTGYTTVYYPLHGFNTIINMVQNDLNTITIQTKTAHYLKSGKIIRIMQTTTSPSLDGAYTITQIVSSDTFKIDISPLHLTSFITNVSGATGILGMNQDFYLYDSTTVGGIDKKYINGVKFTVREVIDLNHFSFVIPNAYASSSETGGGNSVYISSLIHGFNTVQTNTKSDVLNRSINLEGENYAFVTCPQLDTMKNTGSVSNIFARITLDQAPGYVCFNFLSEPKQFNQVPLDSLGELEFSVVNHDNSLYEFNDLDFSFTLEITEVVDTSDLFNISSRRGIVDVS